MDQKDKPFILTTKNADVSIFQRHLSTKFQRSKKRFYEICYYYITVLFNDKGQLLCYNLAVYNLVQSKEEYSLTWKAKPLTIQTDNGKWKKMAKEIKNEKQGAIVTSSLIR